MELLLKIEEMYYITYPQNTMISSSLFKLPRKNLHGFIYAIHGGSSSSSDLHSFRWIEKNGLKVSELGKVFACFGGADRFRGKTTKTVYKEIIMPFNLLSKSFINLLRSADSGKSMNIPKTFIIHAWNSPFLDVYESLSYFFQISNKLGDDHLVWFDIFSNNAVIQHSYKSNPAWWSEEFPTFIKTVGHTVLVLPSLDDLTPLTRTWCLWEIHNAYKAQSTFEIALHPNDHDKLLHRVVDEAHQFFVTLRSKIKIENSECTKQEENDRIRALVKSSGGFEQANQEIYESVRNALMSILAKNLQDPNIPPDMKIDIQTALGYFYWDAKNQARN